MASPTISNPTGAFGYTQPPTTADTSKAGIVREFVSSDTLAVGDTACLSSDGYKVSRATVGMSTRLAVGIAAEAIASGASGSIVLQGPAFAVKKDGVAVAPGDYVGISTASAGSVGLITAATVVTQAKDTGLALGVVIATATSGAGTCSVYIGKI